MTKSILSTLFAVAFLISSTTVCSAQSMAIYQIERQGDGSYSFVEPQNMVPDKFDLLQTGTERVLDVYATEFYVGDLPDLFKNDVSLTVSASTDVTKKERLGDKGLLSLTIPMKIADDTRADGFIGRSLLRNIPFKADLTFSVALIELDGESKDKVEAFQKIILSEKDDENDTLIDLDFGSPYVRLAMAIFDGIKEQKQRSDEIWNNSMSFNISPPIGLMPLKQGEWLLVTRDARKAPYRVDVPSEVVYDGDTLSLTDDAKAAGKKMPTHLILSVNLGVRSTPAR